MIFFALLIATSFGAIYGVDISTLHEVYHFQCMIENGFTFVIPRCYCSVGCMDDNCAQNMINAKNAGMSRVDAYFFPCFSCGNVAGQVSSYYKELITYQVQPERTWFDVEGEWSSSYSTNQAFLMEMVNQARYIGFVHGIYCNYNYWTYFFGYDYTFPYHSETQVWYAIYDYTPSFDGWDQFGGWTYPNIKQYAGNQQFCDGWVDYNYQEL